MGLNQVGRGAGNLIPLLPSKSFSIPPFAPRWAIGCSVQAASPKLVSPRREADGDEEVLSGPVTPTEASEVVSPKVIPLNGNYR